MKETDITSRVGGVGSQLGVMALGGNPLNETVATWVGLNKENLGTSEMDFGTDEGAQKVVLTIGIPTILTRDQVAMAQKAGGIILSL